MISWENKISNEGSCVILSLLQLLLLEIMNFFEIIEFIRFFWKMLENKLLHKRIALEVMLISCYHSVHKL